MNWNINFTTLQKSKRFKRHTETPLKTRRFLTRWRFQTRKKRVFIRRFLKPGGQREGGGKQWNKPETPEKSLIGTSDRKKSFFRVFVPVSVGDVFLENKNVKNRDFLHNFSQNKTRKKRKNEVFKIKREKLIFLGLINFLKIFGPHLVPDNDYGNG